MSGQRVTFLTVDQYLELEEKNEFRSEFVNGKMFAMAIPTRNHSRIASNTQGELHEQLRGRPCGATGADTRVFIAQYNAFTYPDVVVTCGPDRLYSDRPTLTDATMVVE
jgi:Uma2 family endonuclease